MKTLGISKEALKEAILFGKKLKEKKYEFHKTPVSPMQAEIIKRIHGEHYLDSNFVITEYIK